MDNGEKFLKCIEKWDPDVYDEGIEKALDGFDEWLGYFEEDERNTMITMLEKFNYYTLRRVSEILVKLHKKAIVNYNFSNDNSIVSVVRKKDGMLGSSSEYWFLYKGCSGLSKKIFYDTLNEVDDTYWDKIKYIIFIDDCSGTGQTFTSFLERQKKDLRNKCIIFIAIEVMEDACDHIKKYSNEKGLRIEVVAYNLQVKAFKDATTTEKDFFKRLSQKRNIAESYIWGFKNTEALMSFYNNTPNNTLGIFWFITEGYRPIFPRELEEEPEWKKTCSAKKNRKRQQYNARKTGNGN